MPSKVRLASPTRAFAPVTVETVLLVYPERLVHAPSAPEKPKCTPTPSVLENDPFETT